MPKKYDVAIIGSGPGGYTAAVRLRQLGKSVCVIDLSEERMGGVCLNEGCIPVKSLINSAKLFSQINKSESYGVEAEARPPDMKKLTACSDSASLKLRSALKGLFKKNGIEFITGNAGLASRNKLYIKSDSGAEEIEAENIIIATGSSAAIPAGIRPDGETVVTSSEAIRLQRVPKTLVVIGAGAIGVEFCSLFAALGSKVTLVEAMKNILPFEDEDISKALERTFKKSGVEIFLNARLNSINKKRGACEAIINAEGKEKRIEAECVLIAMGRKPNTRGIGIEGTEIKTIGGFLVTDSRLRTTVENIYAVGDVVNSPMYAHVAYAEGITAAESIAGNKVKPINYENVPSVVFSEPQVASVGLSESKAKEIGRETAISKHFFRSNGLAIATGRDEGFLKLIADKKTREILGAHIIGGDATEMIHEFVIAKNANMKVDDIAQAIHAHPTFSEIAVDTAKALFGKPIHG